ncbi:MAG TPA: ribosome maturation factor RimM [Bacteroidales bacterium]|nr:ribosome maturation factor RimM [Bacteroidales bacterium]
MYFGKDELSLVASVKKTHGLTGNLLLTFHDDASNNIITEKSPVFLHKEGIPVPFISESVKLTGMNLIIKLKRIDSIEKANFFVGCDVYVLSNSTQKDTKNDFGFEFIEFSVYDKHYGFIGKIKHFEIIPGNPVFETELNGKKIIIPFSEHIITKVNKNKKEIHIDAPAGLIEIYLAM